MVNSADTITPVILGGRSATPRSLTTSRFGESCPALQVHSGLRGPRLPARRRKTAERAGCAAQGCCGAETILCSSSNAEREPRCRHRVPAASVVVHAGRGRGCRREHSTRCRGAPIATEPFLTSNQHAAWASCGRSATRKEVRPSAQASNGRTDPNRNLIGLRMYRIAK